ncbi:MAG: HEAT repeat domain-containing protein [Pirellulales bacterium]|nr:HEAT repeat domain-containing protein [Pirellulales bacterium]
MVSFKPFFVPSPLLLVSVAMASMVLGAIVGGLMWALLYAAAAIAFLLAISVWSWHRFDQPPRLSLPEALLKIDQLRDSRVEIRRSAAIALRGASSECKPCISQLLAFINDYDEWVRNMVIQAIGRLGVDTIEITNALAGVLDAHPDAAIEISIAIQKSSVKSDQATSILKSKLPQMDTRTRILFAQALWSVEGHLESIIPIIDDGLKSNDVVTRRMAADMLASNLAVASTVVPLLKRLLNDTDRRVRKSCLKALHDIGEKQGKIL